MQKKMTYKRWLLSEEIEEAENKKTETDKTETNQEEQSNVAEQTKDEEHQENKEKVKVTFFGSNLFPSLS